MSYDIDAFRALFKGPDMKNLHAEPDMKDLHALDPGTRVRFPDDEFVYTVLERELFGISGMTHILCSEGRIEGIDTDREALVEVVDEKAPTHVGTLRVQLVELGGGSPDEHGMTTATFRCKVDEARRMAPMMYTWVEATCTKLEMVNDVEG